MKKTVKVLLTLVALFIGFSFANAKGNTVLAAETEKEYKTVLMDVKKDETPVCTDDGQEWLFAGWFEDEKCEVAYNSFPTGVAQAYAKFVPEKVLSVKLQLTEGTNGNSDKTNMRLVSSVDSLDYRKVGFKVYFNGAENPVDIYTSKVYERIVASAESGVDYNYSPKVVDTDSEYFVTATLLNIANTETTKNFDKSFYIRPYWITLDGTEVYGENRYVTVEDGYSASIINLPVKMDEASSQNLTVSGVTGATASLANYDGTYAHVRINLGSTNKITLKSVTAFNVNGVEAKHRNLLTTHVVAGDATAINADTSWYADYETEDEFIIATSADLYGLAKSSSKDFLGKTIYVVADIEANKGRADLSGWLSEDEEGNAIEGVTSYQWTSIFFQGVFDAQMHTISGLYMNDVMNDSGLFRSIYSSTVIRNLKLTNSYFNGGSRQRIGSIVGDAQGGTIESVYSDAIVVGNNNNFGGFIGRHKRSTSALTMKNCWFAGSVSNGATYTGGFIGNALSESKLINCLNTGTVQGTKDYVGGFAGHVDDKTVTLASCLNSGSVEGGASYVGTIAGAISSTNSTGAVVGSDTFVLESEVGIVNGGDLDGITSISAATIVGVKALNADTKALFSYINEETQANESYWAIVSGGTPVLASFKEFAKVDGENAGAMAVDTSWYNTVDTEFVLNDAADLYGLAFLSQDNSFTGKNFKLSKDITINTGTPYGEDGVVDTEDDETPDDWSRVAPEYEWIGIGTSTYPFAGKFNGNMKTISGVYLSASQSYAGLFNYTDGSATIKNLKLTDSYFYTAKGAIGSIVGMGDGTFDSIYSNAIVDGTSFWIGGLIGRTQETTIGVAMNNCWFDGKVTQLDENATQYASTGGLIGLVYNGSAITNCLNTGAVTAYYTAKTTPCVAGLVGRVNSGTVTVHNSLNTGVVTVDESATGNYGPIVGVGTATRIAATDTYAVTDETGAKSIWPAGVTKVANANINGTDAMKNMKNLFTVAVDDGLYESCWAVVVGKAPVLESFADVAGEDFLTVDTSWYNGSGNYTLKDVADLYGFSMLSGRIDFSGETISLSKDIDSIVINEGTPNSNTWNPKYEWISIGATGKPFAGVFDGNMKSIEGAYWNCESFSGLFSAVKAGSVIRNLSLKNGYMESIGVNNGSIVGRAFGGTLDTVYSDTVIVGNNTNIGGLVGQVPSSATEALTLNNCWFDGSVTNNASEAQNTGGLIGTVLKDANVTNCLNTGAISMPKYSKNEGTEEEPVVKPCVGGFVGYVASDVKEGEETRDTNVLFSRCFNAGVITYNNVTGITGFGTFAGYTPKTSVCFQDSYSTIENGLKAYARGSSDTILSNFGRFDKSEAYGTKAFEKASALFKINADENYRFYWAVVSKGTPVLASFAEYAGKEFIAIDTSWYDANEYSYTLNDVGDLYGFALISDEAAVAGYTGKTITLGADIAVNEGTPYGADGVVGGGDDWADVAPQFEWRSICGNTSYRFNGTFEGNGKTISGLYLDETNKYRGLFGLIDVDATLQNFSLVNSYFNGSAQGLGSVVGHSRGTIDTIYSNAIVVGNQSNVGGILGQVDGTYGMKSMSNCWFEGTVTNNAIEGQSTGGLIGAAIGNVSVVNCLNTGAISVPNYAKNEGTEEAPSIKPLVGGLLGYVDSAKTVTVQHCLNIGKVSFNSIATTGFGSVIGRIKSRAEGVTEDGNIIVENTYATSQSSWETVSTSDTWSQVNVSVVDDNVIGGENGKELLSGLFDANLTEKWMIAAEHPVLKVFEKYASTEKNITALHQWVTSSDTLTATLQNPITLPNPEGVALADVRRQGGYTDGRYFYQAFITYTDPGDTDQAIAAETGNKVSVLKYDLINKTEVWLHELTLNHANDITYNSKMKCLVVSHAAPNNKQISYIDVTDEGLVFRETVDIGYDIAYIDYDATRDVYVAGRSSKFFVLNSELKKISKDFTPVRVSGEHTGQGVSCDDNYIYFVLSAGTVETEVIEVYDWSGKLVKTITLDIKTNSETIESENISVVGDKIYIMVAELSDVVGIQYDKPANVYIIDKSVTE